MFPPVNFFYLFFPFCVRDKRKDAQGIKPCASWVYSNHLYSTTRTSVTPSIYEGRMVVILHNDVLVLLPIFHLAIINSFYLYGHFTTFSRFIVQNFKVYCVRGTTRLPRGSLYKHSSGRTEYRCKLPRNRSPNGLDTTPMRNGSGCPLGTSGR